MVYKSIISEINNRIKFIDYLKAISALMIIIYHFSDAGFFPNNYNSMRIYVPGIGKILLGLCSISVPLFFMVNGTLTLDKKYTFKQITQKILSIIKIYFFWGFIISIFFNLPDITPAVVINTFLNGLGWFWFLKTLALLYLFNYIYNKLPFKKKLGKYIILILLIFPFGTNFLWVLLIYFNPQLTLPKWGLSGFFTLYSIVYYLLSKYLPLYFSYMKSLIFILIGLSLNVFEVYVYTNSFHVLQDNVNAFFPTIGTLLMTIGLFNIFKISEKKLKPNKIIYWIGSNCLGIYLFHAPLIYLLKKFIVGNIPVIEGIFLCFLILIISALISSFFKLLKPLGYLLKI